MQVSSVVLEGDCLDVLKGMESESVDALVTDPPAGISFMSAKWDSDRGSRNNWIAWLTEVMEEVLRVMRPGAHGLVWALPRTSHWAAMALEDAGFEVRDRITHHFGSGFPKSANVSKHIDRMRQDNVRPVCEWLGKQMLAAGWKHTQLAEHFGFNESRIRHWIAKAGKQDELPTWEHWLELKTLLGFSDEMDAEVWRLNGRKGQPGDAWYEREVIGEKAVTKLNPYAFKAGQAGTVDITAPATEAAKQWEGWGTSLKPAVEDWFWVQKPLSIAWYCSIMIQTIGEWESELCKLTAKNAGESSRHTPQRSSEDRGDSALTSAPTNTGAAQESATETGAGDVTSLEADTSALTSEAASIVLNMLSSWRSILEDALSLTSRFTTETESSLITDLKTLNSLLSQTTPASMLEAALSPSGSPSPVPYADALLNGLDVKLSYIRTQFAPESVSGHKPENELNGSQPSASATNGAASSKPSTEDWWLVRKPLSESSVARNVLEHGCGAINIDASRISDTIATPVGPDGEIKDLPGGRWPSNLLLSHIGGPEGCRCIGEKRVKGTQGGNDTPKKNGHIFAQDEYTQEKMKRSTVGHADPDGMETVVDMRCHPECPILALDSMSGPTPSGGKPRTRTRQNGAVYSEMAETVDYQPYADTMTGGSGPSRFFQQFPGLTPDTHPGFIYQAKSSRRERNLGLEGMPESMPQSYEFAKNGSFAENKTAKNGKQERIPRQNSHPTVKSLALCDYLVRLITPPGGTVLDCFAGSGSTGCSAVRQGFNFIGIEQSPEYCEIARRRIAYWSQPEEAPKKNGHKPDSTRSDLLAVQFDPDALQKALDTLF